MRHESAEQPLKLIGLLALIGIAPYLIASYVMFVVPFAFSNMPEMIESFYPRDLVVTIANGHVSTNQPEPYRVPNPFGDFRTKYLVVFDGRNTLSMNLRENSTYALVKDTYMISGAPGQERIVYFADHVGIWLFMSF